MSYLQTIPSEEDLEIYESEAPKYMRPNRQPLAVVAEGLLTPDECEQIVEVCELREGYRFNHCNALTREIHKEPKLNYVEHVARTINDQFWQYDLDPEVVSWMQTYEKYGDYALHSDGSPGRMRKMTAVVILSSPYSYEGGLLELFHHPAKWSVPKAQGTVVCFQPWVLHKVTHVAMGIRKSLNMGFWGPNFR